MYKCCTSPLYIIQESVEGCVKSFTIPFQLIKKTLCFSWHHTMCPFLKLLRMWRWFLVFLFLCGRHPLFSSERKWLKSALSSGFRVIFTHNALSPTSFTIFHSAPHSPTSETLYRVLSFTTTSMQTTESPKKLNCLIYELIWFKQCSKTSTWWENTTGETTWCGM